MTIALCCHRCQFAVSAATEEAAFAGMQEHWLYAHVYGVIA